MGDEMDRAQAHNADFQEFVLDRTRKNREPANYTGTDCVTCGEEIPEARRKSVPGCCRCVKCQQAHEEEDEKLLTHWR